MADKDVDGVIAALGRAGAMADATVICTSVDLARAMAADELAARWRGTRPDGTVLVEPDPIAAVDGAIASGPAPETGRSSSPVRSILSEPRANYLVDDPALRDPSPSEDA